MGIKGKFKEILYIEDTPHRLALSFSVGVFIAISPLLGLHTMMALATCFFYRFNKFALFVGVYITNPWTIIPIYTFCTWVGAHIMGVDLGVLEIDWANIGFMTIIKDLEAIIVPFFVGTIVVSVAASLLSYPIFRSAVASAKASRMALEAVEPAEPGEGQ